VFDRICGSAGAQENFPVCQEKREGFSLSGGRILARLSSIFGSKPNPFGFWRLGDKGLRPSMSSLARSCPCKHDRDLAPFVNEVVQSAYDLFNCLIITRKFMVGIYIEEKNNN
jgi:hypothetical protein